MTKLGVLAVCLGSWAVAGCVYGSGGSSDQGEFQPDDGDDDDAQCTAICMSGAQLQADLAPDVDDSGLAFEVCRNEECYQGVIPQNATGNTWPLSSPTPSGLMVTLSVSDGRLHLAWYEPYNLEAYVDGDRFHVTVGDSVILDQTVSYEDVTMCAGTCRKGEVVENDAEAGGS